MKVAVIGGAGFVGSALVRRLVSDGHLVTVFDNFSRGSRDNIPDGVRIVQSDALDGIPVFSGYDWVYDFAARVYGVRDLYKDPARLLSDNIRITTSTLEAVVGSDASSTGGAGPSYRPSYFYVSSSCVYDFPGAKVPHAEDDTNICDTSYGFSKVAGEQLTKWYAKQYGLNTRVARLFNVYGPGDSFQSPHVVPEFIRKAQACTSGQGSFPILGSGNQTRDFTFMDDVIEGLLTIAQHGLPGEAYNIGTGREITIYALARMVCDAVGTGPVAFTHESVAKEDIQRRAADNRRLRALGWEPKVTLEEGIHRLVTVPVTA